MKSFKQLQTLIERHGGETTVFDVVNVHKELAKYFPLRYGVKGQA